ncbi:hypothetical protein [Deinococcus sp. Leaf326]|uniref:hypothetical protein n=1 Tax=Deinococcus sp. Leaf326 TaxID=1736338 RepID=UPI0006F78353|nr:hypothetical protein [Deinococcus sp. Leaf326]KQR18872.1 hypothetical protein ASF71_19770 [Deinococcus sp. Leaf326]
MNDALTTAATAPATRSFDLVNWHVKDSFTRVEARGPHDLTNRLLKLPGVPELLTWDQAHLLACGAWTSALPQDHAGVSVEPSWG